MKSIKFKKRDCHRAIEILEQVSQIQNKLMNLYKWCDPFFDNKDVPTEFVNMFEEVEYWSEGKVNIATLLEGLYDLQEVMNWEEPI